MKQLTEKTGQKQVKQGQFPKGTSGNPKGRPTGARNKATITAEALLDGEASAITKKAIELAKAGDLAAIRLCLERILPPRKYRPLDVTVTKIESPKDILVAVNGTLSAVTSGRITMDEADAILRTIEAARKAMETEELHSELDEMQKRLEVIGG